MAVKLHPTTTTLSAAIEDGYGILSELRDELQEANDNTPDSLQGGEAYSAREEAISQLDGFCDEPPEVHGEYVDEAVTYSSNRRKSQSRSDRRDEAVRMIQGAVEALQNLHATIEEQEWSDDSDKEAVLQSLSDTFETLEGHADEADAVEFPGRNG